MAKGYFKNIAIKGIACAVPDQKREADYWYDKFGQDAVNKFINMTGVKRVCQTNENQTASDLAFTATKALFENRNINPKSIGALVFISQAPDYRLPATACVLQYRLNLPENSICFDVNLGCSGYVNGINIVASLMENSDIDRALLLVGDTSTKGISPEDKSSAMLFGDGAAATLLEKCNCNESKINIHLRTDGNRFKAIIKPAGAYRNLNAPRERVVWNVDGNIRSDYETYMNGADVFTFTISEVPKLIKEFIANNNTNVDYYDCYAMHQANLYILRQIAKKVKIPMDKIPISMDRFGNTSVTSIPLTLADAYGCDNNGKVNTLMCGFGVGLSWGVVSTSIEKSDILPIIYSNDYYKDGGVSHD